jgi:Chalcone isomerase-like
MNGVVRRAIAALSLALIAVGAGAQPAELEGVKLDPTAQVGGATLQLNGAGLRTRVFFKVYVAGLYVPQKANNAGALLAQKGPRRVAITMLRNVDADTFSGALVEGLKNNLSEAQYTGFKAQIDTLIANFKAAGEAKAGDVIHLDFAPEAGTKVIVNGKAQGSAIAGEDFYTALLRIWLGDKPADGDLKKGMLGA